MNIEIPEFALVLLVGASGMGKSTFAVAQFLPTEVISSDQARAWVADDEGDQTVTGDAFDLVHAVVDKRLKNRRLLGTVPIHLSHFFLVRGWRYKWSEARRKFGGGAIEGVGDWLARRRRTAGKR